MSDAPIRLSKYTYLNKPELLKQGPACSTFLDELSRKLEQKRREELSAPKNIVGSILSSLTNALPVVLQKGSPVRNHSPVKIETLQSIPPELQSNDIVEIVQPVEEENIDAPVVPIQGFKRKFKIPKMPVITSDVFKPKSPRISTQDAAVNTSSCYDLASSLAKYVDTLKKISLIAEEFNQKTAKNLKEIVDSVQEDLQIKLEELVNEQKSQLTNPCRSFKKTQ